MTSATHDQMDVAAMDTIDTGDAGDAQNQVQKTQNTGNQEGGSGAGTLNRAAEQNPGEQDAEGEDSDNRLTATKEGRKDADSDLSGEDAALAAAVKRGAPRLRAREAAKPTATPTESVAMEISSGEEDEPADGGPASEKGKGKARPKKSKLTVKDEDLDPNLIPIAASTQALLDDAFLGFVRVDLVDPDPTVDHHWREVNARPEDPKHRRNIYTSLLDRKVDWEHPVEGLANLADIDPTCLSKSVHPIANLKPIKWLVPPGQRRLDYLSGNHRRLATKDLRDTLVEKKGTLEDTLREYVAEQVALAQKKMKASGHLGDEREDQFNAQIVHVSDAIEDAKVWTLRLSDTTKIRANTVLTALLATNEFRPAKAADTQEKVQMMWWRVDNEMKLWRRKNMGQKVPAPGTHEFTTEILGKAVNEIELKEGTVNFLFKQEDNLKVVQNMWQFPYFQVKGKVPLSRLEKSLGKVGKRDLSKKSGSAMVWRWLIHYLIRDLRLVGTTDLFPDVNHPEDVSAIPLRNYVKSLEGTTDNLELTDQMWEDAGYRPQDRNNNAARSRVMKTVYEDAASEYLKVEDEFVEQHKLSTIMWDTYVMAILDKVYVEVFHASGAYKKFGDWESNEWKAAMNMYRGTVGGRLVTEWVRIRGALGKGYQERQDGRALRYGAAKLSWVRTLQMTGGRIIDAPFLCGQFLQDFSSDILAAEPGFKLIARTLDPLAQVGLLRSVSADKKGDKKAPAREVFNDYLSYVVGYLNKRDRFSFKTKAEIEDLLSSWLLSNLSLITSCGTRYQTKYLKAEHEAFYGISMSNITAEFAKLHPKRGKKDITAASHFPVAITKACPSFNFDKTDCDAVLELYKILMATASRLTDKSKGNSRIPAGTAFEDGTAQVLPTVSAEDVKTHPCLAMLYRHALAWQTAEAGSKTGKANAILAYAYMIYVAWRVYGDTIGRMLHFRPYQCLRQSLFRFLGSYSEQTINNFFAPTGTRAGPRIFANWDHALLDSFVDRTGIPIVPEEETNDGPNSETVLNFEEPTIKLFDPIRMSEHTAAVKKILDSIGRCPLALGPTLKSSLTTPAKDRQGPWSSDVATIAESLAKALMRHALAVEAAALAKTNNTPMVELSDEDIEQFLPPLPSSVDVDDGTFSDLEHFARTEPSKYTLYCHGLVAEGYEQAKPSVSTSSPTAAPVHRRSELPSGQVYPQQLDWSAEWAKVKPKSLDVASLPNPVLAARKKFADTTRTQASDPAPPATPADPVNIPQVLPTQELANPTNPANPATTPQKPYVPAFTIPEPRAARKKLDVQPPTSPDAMLVDPAAPRPITAPVSTPSQPALVPPSLSNVPVLATVNNADTDSMEMDPIDPQPLLQPLPLPRPRVRKTIIHPLAAPTPAETDTFTARLDGLDTVAMTQIVKATIQRAAEDADVGCGVNESPVRLAARCNLFWAIVRDTKGSVIPDDIFAYMRSDHRKVDSAVPWEDFSVDFGTDESGGTLLYAAGERFSLRDKDNNAAILDIGDDGQPIMVLSGASAQVRQPLPGNIYPNIAELFEESNRRVAALRDQGGQKRRDRSLSLIEATRADGGASPPKQKPRRDRSVEPAAPNSSSLSPPPPTTQEQASDYNDGTPPRVSPQQDDPPPGKRQPRRSERKQSEKPNRPGALAAVQEEAAGHRPRPSGSNTGGKIIRGRQIAPGGR